MSIIHCPHDKLFKSAMADIRVARDFFQHHLPDKVLKDVDLNTLEICKDSFVNRHLDASYSDILYKVMILGEIGYLYLLCEHKSTVKRFMPLQLWEYIISIWTNHLKQTQDTMLPLVVPMLFYHGKEPYSGPTDIRDLINAPAHLIEDTLFKPIHLIDTHNIPDEALREQEWAGVLAFTMKHILTRDTLNLLENLLEILQRLQETDPEGTSDFATLLLKYLLAAGKTDCREATLKAIKEKNLSGPIGEKMVSLADLLIEEGKLEGIQTGIKTGIKKGVVIGESTALISLIEHKFGSIPHSLQQRIQEADSPQLLKWIKRTLEIEHIFQLLEEESSELLSH